MVAFSAAGQSNEVEIWKRPSEMTNGTPDLWGANGVLPTGIGQGSLGDCWYLAAIAALAERPERIKKLFKNTKYSEEGIFDLNFFVGGKPTTLVIDD